MLGSKSHNGPRGDESYQLERQLAITDMTMKKLLHGEKSLLLDWWGCLGAVRKVGDGAFRGIGGSWVCLVFAHTNRFYWPDKVRF